MATKKEVAFLLPPARHTARSEFCPLGVGIIAARVRSLGHRVRILDAGGTGPQKYWDAVPGLEADIVGVGGTITQLRAMKQTARMVRRSNPKACVFFAGPGVLSDSRSSLLQDADAVLYGEGEDAVPLMVDHGIHSETGSPSAGWAWKNRTGEACFSGMAPYVDVSALPLPAWDLYPLETYLQNSMHRRGQAVMHLIASRGCAHQCDFCDNRMTGSTVRRRPVKHVIEEILDLEKRFAAFDLHDFYFWDPSFLAQSPWRDDLLGELAELGRFTWACDGRVDAVSGEMLSEARKAGCHSINFGVETASSRLLLDMRKGITANHVREAFQLCHEEGIRPGALLMIGWPGETHDDVHALKLLLKDIRPTFINVAVATPFPGTRLHERYSEMILPVSAEEYGDYFPERSLFKSLSMDVASVYRELSAYYLQRVNPRGHVSPMGYC